MPDGFTPMDKLFLRMYLCIVRTVDFSTKLNRIFQLDYGRANH